MSANSTGEGKGLSAEQVFTEDRIRRWLHYFKNDHAAIASAINAVVAQRDSALRLKLEQLVANMPHNGATMFCSNKNALGHDQSCYKCKLSTILTEESSQVGMKERT